MNADAVVIGAGVDELVAAHTLARAGYRVLVLEERAASGDAQSGWVPPRIARDLALDRHGLKIDHTDPWVSAALPDGGRLELWRDVARSAEAIRRLSTRDAAKWPAFCDRMARLARLLEAVYTAPPPDPISRKLGELARLAGLGLRARRLGRQGIEDLLRLLPMSVADFLDDWFEADTLKGLLGAAGVMHLQQGPRSGGTAFRLLHQLVGSPAGVFRPPRSNIARVLSELPGVERRRDAQVVRITVREGRAIGVGLASGEEIAASIVVSGADPQRTLLELVDPGWLDPELARAVRNIRRRGVVARVTLTVDREPGFSTLVLAPSLDDLEHAYDDVKYGRVSARPYLEARSAEPLADGRHRLHVHVQYAPYTLADGEWDDARRAALGDLVVETLSPHLPAVVERTVLAPPDLEEAYGWPEGQAHHAELALDQVLWMRPVPALARYATPIEGLYLCGPSMHPGGGIAGAAGANAARVIRRGSRRQ
ncbi:MAG TPA: NAD(P)/FAD-dependent oxidoreductase [Burkholderiales bacterium]|nr:NAD(P)/FAD-dependent oxidoreductase [Burkholderiales bacterium]